MASYAETIAAMRAERAQREHLGRLEDLRRNHYDATKSRDEAYARGDREDFESWDDYAHSIEREYAALCPPQQPQIDPRLVKFAQQNQQFFEKYGPRAYQALDAAHAYMMRPRRSDTNDPRYRGMGWNPQHVFTPAYFDRLKSLLELHGEQFLGVNYDRNSENLTPNEAARISGLSPQRYNAASRAVAAAGKFGTRR
jgi:hypothetical protein